MQTNRKFGYIPDLPDYRDINSHSDLLPKLRTPTAQPTSVNLSAGFSPIEDQGQLGSCTANAAAGLMEYMERKSTGRHVDASRLFIYKNTRLISGLTGDSGAYIRDTIKSLRLFGAVPEKYHPYDVAKFDDDISAYKYAFAQNYKSLQYFRVDDYTWTTDKIFQEIRNKLIKGIPLIFGFTCYDSIFNTTTVIPFPAKNESIAGGHAMVICGYDDSISCPNTTRLGAFLVRNSWGTNWGMKGYAWLPYEYLYAGLMEDIWGIIKQDWVDTKVFD